MTRVMVTGAGGFIGRHLTRLLTETGHPVIALGRREADVTDAGALLANVSPCDVLVHLAFPTQAERRAAQPLEALEQAACGTINAVRLAEACGVRQVVLSSSGKVFGAPERLPFPDDHPARPTTLLGRLKCLQESILGTAVRSVGLAGGWSVSSLRLFNVYGPDQADGFAVPHLVAGARSSGPLVLGELDHRRDWIHVDDACAAILAVIEQPAEKGQLRLLNVGSGRSAPVREILDVLGRLRGSPLEVHQEPSLLRPEEEPEEYGDCSGLVAMGWRPQVTLEQGLRDLWEQGLGP